MTDPMTDPAKAALLAAILPHVPFDGWSPVAFDAAVEAVEITKQEARSACPRGAVDLAVAYHREGDRAMARAMQEADMGDMRYRDKVAFAIRARLDAAKDKEVVRRGTALFALPHLAAEGARLIWGTADAIWDALGDTSKDVNWYTKRASLAGVYGSSVLYWLGDDSFERQATEAFIERRIDNVMQVEKVKAHVRANPFVKPVLGAFDGLMGMIKAPGAARDRDVPGRWAPEAERPQ